MTPVLAVSNLSKAFGGVVAADEVSFEIAAGELLAIIGPNGAGKSTTFNMVGGQLQPDRGTVKLNGRDITGLPPRRIWRMGVGRTFQITATFASMTVVENVQMPLISHHGKSRALFSRARDLYRDAALAALERVGIAGEAERPCSVLSYGDLKRVELAVALAAEPKLLLMDEPTAGMAPSERIGLMKLTAEIARERDIAVLFTEHDMDVVFSHSDRILVLQNGRTIAEGLPEEVRENPKVREVYLGSTLEETA
ncbi:MAG: ABC transporter ATP-binding protein [Rhodobiaceae bacterium]|nr:ABC transporter ATP-binding protein [Rhodobiaceae bacterium]